MPAVTAIIATMIAMTAGSIRVIEARLARVNRSPTCTPISVYPTHCTAGGTDGVPNQPVDDSDGGDDERAEQRGRRDRDDPGDEQAEDQGDRHEDEVRAERSPSPARSDPDRGRGGRPAR